MAVGDSPFSGSGNPIGVKNSPFIDEGKVVSASRPQEATFNPGRTQTSPFVEVEQLGFSEVDPDEVDHDHIEAVLTSAGAAPSEIQKIRDLVEQEVGDVKHHVVTAIQAGEDEVKAVLEKLRAELHIDEDASDQHDPAKETPKS